MVDYNYNTFLCNPDNKKFNQSELFRQCNKFCINCVSVQIHKQVGFQLRKVEHMSFS